MHYKLNANQNALPLPGDIVPSFKLTGRPVGSYDPTDLPALPEGERLRPGDVGVFPSGEAFEIEWASESEAVRASASARNGWQA